VAAAAAGFYCATTASSAAAGLSFNGGNEFKLNMGKF
jgi:hypothetical protein